MICKNCNTLNSNDATECINCGMKLEKKINPFVAKMAKPDDNEILLQKIPKTVAKKKQIQFLKKINNEITIVSLTYFTVVVVLAVLLFLPVATKIIEAAVTPIINLSNNLALNIGLEDQKDYSGLLTSDIIPAPTKNKVIKAAHKPVKTILIKPAEIKKDKAMEYYISVRDSMKMILIPAGESELGSDNEGINEKPMHRSFVAAFFMDQHEVTNSQYRKFCLESGYRLPKFINDTRFNGPNQPVVGVSFEDAANYARWAGKRLPTESEWERAARAGQIGVIYPFGTKITPSLACYDLNPDTDGPNDVKSYSTNRYFIYDLCGNAAEWTQSVPQAYSGGSLDKDYGSNYRVIKGGCWKNIAADVTISKRDIKGIKWNNNDVGFRCVMDY